MRKLNVGIVGCGFIAQHRHIPSFLRLRGSVSLKAVCDLRQTLASEVSREFSVPHVYTDLSEMLSREKLDLIDICTPPAAHASVATKAMESGCHVLMEKPMALDVSDCDKMIQTSRKCGTKLSVVHNQLFYPPFIKAKQLVDNDVIGRIVGMRILSLTHKDEYMTKQDHWVHKLPGGIVGETGPHAIYMALAFMKRIENVDVWAKKNLDYPWVLYDDYRIELKGERIDGSIYISHSGSYTTTEVDLFGTKGGIRMDLDSMLLTNLRLERLEPISVALSSLKVAFEIVK
jgi:predicted dehydrogenase